MQISHSIADGLGFGPVQGMSATRTQRLRSGKRAVWRMVAGATALGSIACSDEPSSPLLTDVFDIASVDINFRRAVPQCVSLMTPLLLLVHGPVYLLRDY